MAFTIIQGSMRAETATAQAFARVNALFGGRLIISSPYGADRTRAQQGVLYNLYKSGKGSPANPPGSSNHEGGRALDIWNWASFPSLRSVMAAHGFTRDPREQWHYNFNTASASSVAIETKVEHKMSVAIFRSIRQGVGEFLIYASPAQVASSRELSTASADDRAFEFRVAQAIALAVGLGANYEIPTIDDSPNGGWYVRNQVAGRVASMPASFPLSPTNPFIPLTHYGREGGEWAGPTVAEIEAALADDFAAVKAAIPTEFTITAKA